MDYRFRKIEMGEDLAMEFWEILTYLLLQERVKKTIEEYAERTGF